MTGLFSLTLIADDQSADNCFPNVDLSLCAVVQEVRFFVGMVPVSTFPSQRIRESLVSVVSRRVRTIVLDLIIDHGVDVVNEDFFRGFAGLDPQLKRIASEYEGVGKTVVKLSANLPFGILGSHLTDFRTCGVLDFGSRIGGPLHCVDVQWFDGDGER